MPKFKEKKKVIKAQGGVFFGSTPIRTPDQEAVNPDAQLGGMINRGASDFASSIARALVLGMGGDPDKAKKAAATQPVVIPQTAPPVSQVGKSPNVSPLPAKEKQTKPSQQPIKRSSNPAPSLLFSGYPAFDYMTETPAAEKGFSGYSEYDPMADTASPAKNAMTAYKGSAAPLADMSKLFKEAAKAPGASPEMAKAAGEIPKTKAGMKKFMQDYGKFIALGAMAGAGGKGGQIAAPIMAALPGLIEMMKKRGKKAETKAHGGSMAKKSSGGDTPKKSEGGAIRKFKGGSMNTKDSMLTPKYKKGGDMPKAKTGKAVGEMPQHKKMAMGNPTPQSTGQKFAKGGAAKYAGGGMCKGYGISKKIRPTGPMN